LALVPSGKHVVMLFNSNVLIRLWDVFFSALQPGRSSSCAFSPLHQPSVSHLLLECAGWPVTSALVNTSMNDRFFLSYFLASTLPAPWRRVGSDPAQRRARHAACPQVGRLGSPLPPQRAQASQPLGAKPGALCLGPVSWAVNWRVSDHSGLGPVGRGPQVGKVAATHGAGPAAVYESGRCSQKSG
jgi:hypothetical protein